MPYEEDYFSMQVIQSLSVLNAPSPSLLRKKCNAAKQQQQIRESKAEEGVQLWQLPQLLLKSSVRIKYFD